MTILLGIITHSTKTCWTAFVVLGYRYIIVIFCTVLCHRLSCYILVDKLPLHTARCIVSFLMYKFLLINVLSCKHLTCHMRYYSTQTDYHVNPSMTSGSRYCSQWLLIVHQGSPQDVKSQDRDGQPSRPRRDRDVSFFSNYQDRDVEPSRPRRDVQPPRPRRDETRRSKKKRLETASRPRRKTETFQKTYQDRSVAV